MTPHRLSAITALALALANSVAGQPAGAQECCSKELIEAATKEGQVVLYSGVVLDNEQILAQEFSKRFPGITVDIVRAPGSRLFTRIQTEAAGGKLGADVADLTDRALATRIDDLFADYAPPNAANWDTGSMLSKKVWPRTLYVYGLAYNPAIVAPPSRTWRELENPKYDRKIGLILAGSGGSAWTFAMFQRQMLGLDNWKNIAALNPRLFDSNGPASSGLIQGEIHVASLLLATVTALKLRGAPIDLVYPTEGLPAAPGAAGIFKAAPHPNAARLFMDWALSTEGQNTIVEKLGGMSLLKGAKMPAGAPADAKLWIPDNTEFDQLRDKWVKEWNSVFGYRD